MALTWLTSFTRSTLALFRQQQSMMEDGPDKFETTTRTWTTPQIPSPSRRSSYLQLWFRVQTEWFYEYRSLPLGAAASCGRYFRSPQTDRQADSSRCRLYLQSTINIGPSTSTTVHIVSTWLMDSEIGAFLNASLYFRLRRRQVHIVIKYSTMVQTLILQALTIQLNAVIRARPSDFERKWVLYHSAVAVRVVVVHWIKWSTVHGRVVCTGRVDGPMIM